MCEVKKTAPGVTSARPKCPQVSAHIVNASSLKSINAQAWLKVLLFIVPLNLDWHCGEKGIM